MLLPSLNLKIGCGSYDAKQDLLCDESLRWLKACGGKEHPEFKKWRNVRSKDKNAFHEIVQSLGNKYRTSYTNSNIKTLRGDHKQSIEHVWPRSFVNGRFSGAAENDPFSWASVDRKSNSTRSNLPLVLWPTFSVDEGIVDIGGERHFNPPNEHKARLARRWVYIRATYALIDDLASPSYAQLKHADAILSLIATTTPSDEELELHAKLSERYGGWVNPLMFAGPARDDFLESEAFRMLVFEGTSRFGRFEML